MDEAKQKFIVDFEKHEDVMLDPQLICSKKPMRTLGKLATNSVFGKFGKRNVRTKIEFVDNPFHYFEMLSDDKIQVVDVHFENENMVRIQWITDEYLTFRGNHSNLVIASFVTAQARLHLYGFLNQLKERIFYCDSDSVISLEHPNDAYKVPTGNYFG